MRDEARTSTGDLVQEIARLIWWLDPHMVRTGTPGTAECGVLAVLSDALDRLPGPEVMLEVDAQARRWGSSPSSSSLACVPLG